jgi:carbonic anhydrase
MRDRERAGQLKLHGWWFDIATAEVLALDGAQGRFVVIDEDEAARIVARLEER